MPGGNYSYGGIILAPGSAAEAAVRQNDPTFHPTSVQANDPAVRNLVPSGNIGSTHVNYPNNNSGGSSSGSGGGGGGGSGNSVDVSNRNVVQNTTTTQRKYIDVPTPEEFLDDFQNALAGHLQSGIQSGAVSHQAAQWALSHASQLLDTYTGHLAQMAAQGQQIFKANLPSGDPQYLGTRIGDVTQTQGSTQTNTSGQSSSNGSIVQPSTPAPAPGTPQTFSMDQAAPAATGATATGAPPIPGAVATGLQQPTQPAPGTTAIGPGATGNGVQASGATIVGGGAAAGSGAAIVGSTSGMGLSSASATQNTSGTDTTNEAVYGRPQAGTLHTYSPGQFLQDTLSPTSLSLMYEGSKGESNYTSGKVQRGGGGARILS